MRDRRPSKLGASPDFGSRLAGALDRPSVRSLREWASTGYRPFGTAILIAGILWFAYGLYGSITFTSPGVSVSWWFGWELLAVPTIAVAFVIGASMAPARGIVTDALLVVAVIGGLLLGTALGAGLVGSAAERAFGTFAVGTVMVTALAWLAGSVIAAVLRRGGWDIALGSTYLVISVVLAVIIVAVVLPAIGPDAPEAPRATPKPSTQVAAAARVSIQDVRWDARPHYFLPRFGDRTVALQVGYKARENGTPYARTDWVAHEVEGVAIQASVWPNRRPLRKIGAALDSGLLPRGIGTEGWIAFVVPEDSDQLEVVFEQEEGESLRWQVDRDGARTITQARESSSGDEG